MNKGARRIRLAAAGTAALSLLGIGMLIGCNSGEPAKPAAAPEPAVYVPPLPPAAKAPPMVQTTAKAGVTGKGNYGMGIVTTPLNVYFSARERIVFDIQIPEAMKLFKATEDRAPRTQEEFMEKIIKANIIHLPELPEGHHYVYDPKKEELMVEQPAR